MRLATWNTLWRFGDWQPRQPLLRAAMLEVEPDVVLLQETWPAQAKEFAELLGLSVLGFSGGYFDQTLSSVPVDAEFGNAILATDGEIVVDEVIEGPGDPAPRRLLAADVAVTGGSEVHRVATSHLTHMNEAGATRAAQIRAIVELLGADEPWIFGGDCNLLPHTPEHGVARSLGLRDLWAELRPDDHGATMNPENPELRQVSWMDDRLEGTAPAGSGIRLDYLWATEGVACSSIERFGAGPPVERNADESPIGDTRWPSDHLGLIAQFD